MRSEMESALITALVVNGWKPHSQTHQRAKGTATISEPASHHGAHRHVRDRRTMASATSQTIAARSKRASTHTALPTPTSTANRALGAAAQSDRHQARPTAATTTTGPSIPFTQDQVPAGTITSAANNTRVQ